MRLGVLGGTFDPIHAGHIAAAAAAERALALGRVLLVPSRLPPHRPESARVSPRHRLAMAALAAAEHPNWSASDIELDRDGPSYTFDTLSGLVAGGHDRSQIFFIIGADAFAEIATWSRYPAVLDLAHFAVVARPGITLDSLEKRVPDLADRMTTPDALKPQAPSLKAREKTRVILIEATTPDVSATEIRRRVHDGESIAGLVPDSVAAYIARHRLYVGTNLPPSPEASA
ncbi:MAG: nicotinate (nicotinamide) nucleotide adenylyltransferase [Acidobacteria bacterium RIFCSPLOWO2_12_FULL_67_14b]|nr:MAG: nicotinate (nicotinamide) nucleotide adenylyltransferase [Acidobacteria bacterium RIFCSPLOWO2_12_FULL_67_14b]